MIKNKLPFTTGLTISVCVGIFCTALVVLLYWICGYNFDERGAAAFFCLIFSIAAFGGGGFVTIAILCGLNVVEDPFATE